MKKTISILLTVAMLLTIAVVGIVPTYAVDINKIEGTEITWQYKNAMGGTLVFDGTGAIPDYNDCYDENDNYVESNKVPWKGINYTTIEFGEGITAIGNYAFCRSSELDNVTIPDTVTSIGKGAFYDCTSLKSVTISNEVTVINKSTFVGCSNLMYVKMPDKLTEIKESAFYNCSNLSEITLPDTLVSIGDSAFNNTGLTSVVCPAELTTIGQRAFTSCKALESITFNDKLSSIGDSAFRYSSLKKIEFPSSLETITSQVCADCKSLEEVVIPESVKMIQSRAFLKCQNLKKITIPFSVSEIGDKALGYYDTKNKITGFVIKGYEDEPVAKNYADANGFEFVSLGKIYEGTCGAHATWKFEKSTGTLTISGTGAMANYTAENPAEFSRFEKLTNSIVIGDEIITIGNYAFCGFENATVSLSKCKSLVRIGDYALYNLMDSVYIPASVSYIGEKGVGKYDEEGKADENFVITGEKFSKAKTFALENGFKFNIEDSSFAVEGTCGEKVTWKYNKDDSTLKISGEGEMTDYTVNNLPEYLYHYISNIVIEPGITSIGNYAFIGSDAVNEIYLSPSIEKIGENAIGYDFDLKKEIVKVDGFKIVGFDETAAETYAKANEFEFVSKGKFSGVSGEFGETATWNYNEKLKTLTISGTGETMSFTKEALPTFINYDIEKIVIEEGITKIGDCSLLGFDDVKEIVVANSVDAFGENAIGFTVAEGEIVKLDGLVIKGYDDSQAKLFASENNFVFDSLGRFGVVTGKCGNNVEWLYDSRSKSLTVSGTGATFDYTLESLPEFSEYEIEDITIEDGITALGDYIFVSVKGAYDRIDCCKTIEKLGEKAFGFVRSEAEQENTEEILVKADIDEQNAEASYICIPMENLFVSGYLVTPVIGYAKANNFKFETNDEDRIDFDFEKLPINIDQNSKTVFIFSGELDAEKIGEDCTVEIKEVTLKTGEKLVLKVDDTEYEYTVIVVGDVNADSNVNSSDALEILQHTVGLKTLEGDLSTAADVNSDKNINSSDALCVLQATVGLIKLEDLKK